MGRIIEEFDITPGHPLWDEGWTIAPMPQRQEGQQEGQGEPLPQPEPEAGAEGDGQESETLPSIPTAGDG